MKCDQCGGEIKVKGARLPTGWKRDPDSQGPICRACWGLRYVLRAIEIPVAGPVGSTWEEFRAALKDAWQRATRVANWAVQELMRRDVLREASMEKLPKMEPVYLYGLAQAAGMTEGWSQSAAAVMRTIDKKYRAARLARIWQGKTRLPDTRYPLPYPVHNQGWRPEMTGGAMEIPTVSLRLPGGRFTLRLRTGKEFARQMEGFRQIVRGKAVQGEMTLYRRAVNESDHRLGFKGYRVMCKMVAWFPRKEWVEGKGTLILTTSPEAMLVAENLKDQQQFRINGDQVRRWTVSHQRQLQRWSEDSKMELRRGKAPFAARRTAACRKFQARMKTAADQMAAQVVNYARRRRFAAVLWRPGTERFVESFRWFALVQRIRIKCEECGIEFLTEEPKVEGE